ncbi:hypothetical protein WJX82_010403 [Trebouxia sp. C0006]
MIQTGSFWIGKAEQTASRHWVQTGCLVKCRCSVTGLQAPEDCIPCLRLEWGLHWPLPCLEGVPGLRLKPGLLNGSAQLKLEPEACTTAARRVYGTALSSLPSMQASSSQQQAWPWRIHKGKGGAASAAFSPDMILQARRGFQTQLSQPYHKPPPALTPPQQRLSQQGAVACIGCEQRPFPIKESEWVQPTCFSAAVEGLRVKQCSMLLAYTTQLSPRGTPDNPCSRDMSSGSDSWAVEQGWISITPLGLRSDITFSQELSKSAHSTRPELIQTVTAAMHIAAHSLGVNVGGKPKL